MEEDPQYYPNCDVNVWLRSCKEEIDQPISGEVFGRIPSWLNGVLIRNGPGSLEVGTETFQHLFDSSALLHRFAIKNGKVTYQCRFLRSESYKRNKKFNRIVITEFGTKSMPDPCHTIFQRVAAAFNWKENQSDNANISVYPFGDELYAFTESPVIHRINQDTLETEQKLDVSENVAIVNHTSHPHVVEDGSVYNLAMSITKTGPYHNIVHFPANNEDAEKHNMFERAYIVATIPARWPLYPSYMHTFGITENYFIIVEQPLNLSMPSLIINRIKNEPLAGSLQWHGNHMTQINIICRRTGELTHKFYSQAFFYLHIINQYEITNHIVLDVCSYKDASMLDCMYTEAMKNMQKNPNYANMFRSRPIRFILPLIPKNDKMDEWQNLIEIPNTQAEAHFLPDGNIFVKPEKLCNLGCETPRIHYEKYLGKKYRFYYAISTDVDGDNPGMIIKVDTDNKLTLTWCENNCYPSEPIFVPNPTNLAEDDGVVLAATVWGNDDTNHVGLVILDAKTFLEIGRAEFRTPSAVPKCLHGWFLPE